MDEYGYYQYGYIEGLEWVDNLLHLPAEQVKEIIKLKITEIKEDKL